MMSFRRAGCFRAAIRGIIPHGLLWTVASSCALAPSPVASGSGRGEPLPPPGHGTLRQDEVTVAFSSGELEIKVTPLDRSVILVTAPDTYQRLARLSDMHESANAPPGEEAGASRLFLVSFFSDSPDVAFVPEELQLISRGLRHRPTAIRPVTPGWGQRRLEQRRTETAVYVFGPGVDLESDLTVAYGLVQSQAWNSILPRVRAERARARSRAGVGVVLTGRP
jgi:hypothetical protein